MTTNIETDGENLVPDRDEPEGNPFHEIAGAIDRNADHVMVSRAALEEVYGTAIRLMAAENGGNSAELARLNREREHLIRCGHTVLDLLTKELDTPRGVALLRRTLATAEGVEEAFSASIDAKDPRPID